MKDTENSSDNETCRKIPANLANEPSAKGNEGINVIVLLNKRYQV
jgi:hypothetical protein